MPRRANEKPACHMALTGQKPVPAGSCRELRQGVPRSAFAIPPGVLEAIGRIRKPGFSCTHVIETYFGPKARTENIVPPKRPGASTLASTAKGLGPVTWDRGWGTTAWGRVVLRIAAPIELRYEAKRSTDFRTYWLRALVHDDVAPRIVSAVKAACRNDGRGPSCRTVLGTFPGIPGKPVDGEGAWHPVCDTGRQCPGRQMRAPPLDEEVIQPPIIKRLISP